MRLINSIDMYLNSQSLINLVFWGFFSKEHQVRYLFTKCTFIRICKLPRYKCLCLIDSGTMRIAFYFYFFKYTYTLLDSTISQTNARGRCIGLNSIEIKKIRIKNVFFLGVFHIIRLYILLFIFFLLVSIIIITCT